MMLFRGYLLNAHKFTIVGIEFVVKVYSIAHLVEMTMRRFWTTPLSQNYFIKINFLIDLNEPDVS
jgi:hypothetical protein